jgi:hypothetical protein
MLELVERNRILWEKTIQFSIDTVEITVHAIKTAIQRSKLQQDAIILMKFWSTTLLNPAIVSLKSRSYLMELLTIFAWRQTYNVNGDADFPLTAMFKAVLQLIKDYRNMAISFQASNRKSSTHAIPYCVDFVNQDINVANPNNVSWPYLAQCAKITMERMDDYESKKIDFWVS